VDDQPNDTEHKGRTGGYQLPDGRDELNLAEFPIALLSDRASPGTKTMEFRDRIFDRGTGKEVTRKLTVTGSDRYGLPTARDDDVVLGLIHLTKLANNFTDRMVRFKRYELVSLLGWPMDGRSYRRIIESLNRWLGVTLHYENAWWDKRQKAWVTRGFHIIESFELLDGRQPKSPDEDAELRYSQFMWNEVVFRSFQSDNLKRLDLDRYFRLKSAVSKRIFRFLDKRFFVNPNLQFDLKEFSCEHIGLSRNCPPTKLKRQLQGAIEELEAVGLLDPMSAGERYTKVARGEWAIVLVKKAPAPDEAPDVPSPSDIERELVAREVTPATAAELVAGYPAGLIRVKVEVFDWLKGKGDKRVLKSPAGYLVKSIRDNYVAPNGFEPKATRERRPPAGDEEKGRREGPRPKAEGEQPARSGADRARVDAYWNALSPPEQERLKDEALLAAHPSFLGRYKQNRGKGNDPERLYLKLIIDAHISHLLGEEAPALARKEATPRGPV
jgi:hypothetical protein